MISNTLFLLSGSGTASALGGTTSTTLQRPVGLEDHIGVPNIIIEVSDPNDAHLPKILGQELLPPADEVLDVLGLGPKGIPIPAAATFSLVPLPSKRATPPSSLVDMTTHFVFMASSADDPNQSGIVFL